MKKRIESKSTIKVYYQNEEKKIYIKLNSDERFIQDYRYLNIDATVIQILPKDGIPKDYFLLSDITYLNQFENLINKEIYILHYPKGENFSISYGKIKTVDKDSYTFSYISKTEKGSSGGPIFLLNSPNIIGIHKKSHKITNEKYGDFIYRIIISLQNDFIYLNGIYDEEKNLNLIKYHNIFNIEISQIFEQFNQNCFVSNEKLEFVKLEIEMNDLENNETEGKLT